MTPSKTKGSHDPLLVVSREKVAFLFWALVAASALSALSYVLLINATVFNAVETKKIGEENRRLNGELAALESRYLALSQTVTLERAHQLGFIDVSTVSYASREKKTLLTSNF
ncbi:MAG: hypothetical protein V4674_02475 [Patescibacteria group bacterium]